MSQAQVYSKDANRRAKTSLSRELSQTFLLLAIGLFTLAGYLGIALALVNAAR